MRDGWMPSWNCRLILRWQQGAMQRVRGDEDFFAVERRGVDVIFDVSEYRLAHRKIRRRLQIQQA
jgi:hypothetical protein